MQDDLSARRGEIRRKGFRRVSHGLYLPTTPSPVGDEEKVRDLHAWRLVLPSDAVFTHLTAAEISGWWLPNLQEFVPVFAAMDLTSNRPRRSGLICSRLDRCCEPVWRQGLPTDCGEEVLLRAARDLGVLDVTVLMDSALRQGHATRPALAKLCESGRPGVRRLRTALAFSNPKSESAWESMLRIFHELAGIPVRPQVYLYDDGGRFVARADLIVTGTNCVHEYDGGIHRKVRRHNKDLRRERRFAETPYVRRGYTADDLLNSPLVMLHEIDRAIGRRHDPRRLKPWRLWLQESMYSEAGRVRVMNRWLKVNGVTDWSRTA